MLPAGLEYHPSMGPATYFSSDIKFKHKTAFLIERRFLVLSGGLEPSTYCSASKRSNPLSYESVFNAGDILLYCAMTVKVLD